MSAEPTTAARARAMARIGDGLMNASLGWAAEIGADEALKPIRRLHTARPLSGLGTARMLGGTAECSACNRDWPCATAKLVYAESELAS